MFWLTVLFVVAGARAACPETCSFDAQCADCPTAAAHGLFAGLEYACRGATGTCELANLTALPFDVEDRCRTIGVACCLPTVANFTQTDEALDGRLQCQTKACREAARCTAAGECEYVSPPAPVFEACCVTNGDCPPWAGGFEPPVGDPFALACMRPTCAAGNCLYEKLDRCCVEASDCDLAADFGLPGDLDLETVCVPNPARPGFRRCEVRVRDDSACTADADCEDANPCTRNLCEAGTCTNPPVSVPTEGCCTDNFAVQCATAGAQCDTPVGCMNAPDAETLPGLTLRPTYECLYQTDFAAGCCSSAADCAFINECLDSLCDQDTSQLEQAGQCGLRDSYVSDATSLPCCHVDADCAVPADLCTWQRCTGPVGTPGVAEADAYKCTVEPVAGCTGAQYLAPALAFDPPPARTDCQWECAPAAAGDPNVLRARFTVRNAAADRPLYNYTVRVLVDNAVGAALVNYVLITGTQSSSLPRQPLAEAQLVQLGVQGSAAYQDFRLQPEPHALYPGASVALDVEVAFTQSAAVSEYAVRVAVTPEAPGTGVSLTAQLSPAVQFDLDGSQCSQQCAGAGQPTPAPGVADAPQFAVAVAVDQCQWDCADAGDAGRNAVTVTVDVTNTNALAGTGPDFVNVLLEKLTPAGDSNGVAELDPAVAIALTEHTDPAGTPSLLQVDVGGFRIRPGGGSGVLWAAGESRRYRVRLFLPLTTETRVTAQALFTFQCTEVYVIFGLCTTEGEFFVDYALFSATGRVSAQSSAFTGDWVCADHCAAPPDPAVAVQITAVDCDWSCAEQGNLERQNRYTVAYALRGTAPGTVTLSRLQHEVAAPGGTFDVLEPLALVASAPTSAVVEQSATDVAAGRLVSVLRYQAGGAPVGQAQQQTLSVQFAVQGANAGSPYAAPLYPVVERGCTIVEVRAGDPFCVAAATAFEPVTLPTRPAAPPVQPDYFAQCPAPCQAEPETGEFGVIGDRVWYDYNGNGVQDGGETEGPPNVRVDLFNGTTRQFIATTLTDARGRYEFRGQPEGRAYFLRFDPRTLPFGYEFTAPDRGFSPFLNSDADPETGETRVFALLPDVLALQWDAGLRAAAGCEPNRAGPFADDGVVVGGTGAACDGCFADELGNQCRRCTGLQRGVLELSFQVDNFGFFDEPADTLTVRLLSRMPARFRCGSARLVTAASTAGVGLISTRQGAVGGTGTGGVQAVVGWKKLPAQTPAAARFTLRFAVCTDDAPGPAQFDVVARRFSPACAQLLEQWETCTGDGDTLDYRECLYETQTALTCAGEPCAATLAPTPAPTAAVTRPPTASDQQLRLEVQTDGRGPLCANSAAIAQFGCPDRAATQQACAAAGDRGLLEMRAVVLNEATGTGGAGASHGGVVRVVVARSAADEACGAGPPDVLVAVEPGQSGQPAVLLHRVLNATAEEFTVSFEPLPAGSGFFVSLLALVCAPAPVAFVVDGQIETRGCSDACQDRAQFADRLSTASSAQCPDPRPFLPGQQLVEARPSALDAAFPEGTGIALTVLFLCLALVVLTICLVLTRRRRQRQAPGRGRDRSRPPLYPVPTKFR